MSKRDRLVLIAAIVLLGAVGFMFLIYPNFYNSNELRPGSYGALLRERQKALDDRERSRCIRKYADQLREDYAALSATVAVVEAKLPTRKEIPPLLTAMEQFTKRLSIRFGSIHPGGLEPVAAAASTAGKPTSILLVYCRTPSAPQAGQALPYSRMQVDLALNGTFAQTIQYLRELQDFPRLIVVNSITLAPQTLPRLQVGLQAEIYALGAGASASEAGEAGAPASSTAAPSGAPASRPGATPATTGPATTGPAAPSKTLPPLPRPRAPQSP